MRTKVSNFLKVGVPLEMAIVCGISSKSYWRSAKTEGIHQVLFNEFFAEKGLLSLRDYWVDVPYG
jgi:RNA-directed DNA polymerase